MYLTPLVGIILIVIKYMPSKITAQNLLKKEKPITS